MYIHVVQELFHRVLREIAEGSEEDGQGMIEYGLLVALISIAAVAVMVLIGPQLISIFQTVVNNL